MSEVGITRRWVASLFLECSPACVLERIGPVRDVSWFVVAGHCWGMVGCGFVVLVTVVNCYGGI